MYRVTKTYGHDRGFSCAFRQWASGTDCQYLHGYSLGFKIVLESPTLDEIKFLESWLKKRFDHTLLVAKDDPELDLIKSLNNKAAKIIEMDKISCEYFAEITFNYIEETLADLDIKVVSVEVSEHDSNSAGFYRN